MLNYQRVPTVNGQGLVPWCPTGFTKSQRFHDDIGEQLARHLSTEETCREVFFKMGDPKSQTACFNTKSWSFMTTGWGGVALIFGITHDSNMHNQVRFTVGLYHRSHDLRMFFKFQKSNLGERFESAVAFVIDLGKLWKFTHVNCWPIKGNDFPINLDSREVEQRGLYDLSR